MLFELVCPEGLRERAVARRVRAWIETLPRSPEGVTRDRRPPRAGVD
jgi:hypothetical protein